MSKTQRGGRAPKGTTVSAQLRMFYILIGAVTLFGTVALTAFLLQNQQRATTLIIPSGFIPVAPSGPIGHTADGFAYKGNPDAPVVVTEYADFQ